MFRASLCPPSGEKTTCYCIWSIFASSVGCGSLRYCGATLRAWALWRVLFDSSILLNLVGILSSRFTLVKFLEALWHVQRRQEIVIVVFRTLTDSAFVCSDWRKPQEQWVATMVRTWYLSECECSTKNWEVERTWRQLVVAERWRRRRHKTRIIDLSVSKNKHAVTTTVVLAGFKCMTLSFKLNRDLWNCWLHCRPVSIELLPLDLSVESSVPVTQSVSQLVQCSLVPAKPSHPMWMPPVVTQSYRSNYRQQPSYRPTVLSHSFDFGTVLCPLRCLFGFVPALLFCGPFLWSGVRVS